MRWARSPGNQAMADSAPAEGDYLSGWQVAADANTASAMYPDQSLYPSNAAPELAKRINRNLAARRPDRDGRGQGLSGRHLVRANRCRRRSRFRRPLNAFEIMKAFIEAGAAGVHYEDQLASEKKCGHLAEGSDPDGGAYSQPDGGAACG